MNRRRLFHIATAVSLILCIATIAEWRRSKIITDQLRHSSVDGDGNPSTDHRFEAIDGKIYWTISSVADKIPATQRGVSLSQLSTRRRGGTTRPGTRTATVLPPGVGTVRRPTTRFATTRPTTTRPATRPTTMFSFGLSNSQKLPMGWTFMSLKSNPTRYTQGGWKWRRLGFGQIGGNHVTTPRNGFVFTGPVTITAIPFYAVCAPTLLLPAALILLAARRLRRSRAGRCPHCGYDLTANTSGVCPECGKPVTVHPTPRTFA